MKKRIEGKPMNHASEDRKLVLSLLSDTPKSARELANRVGISDIKKIRNAIDQLRHEYCIWYSKSTAGFWVDDPIRLVIKTRLRDNRTRWRREPDDAIPEQPHAG